MEFVTRTATQLRDDALRIWRAGVAAVQPARLVPEFVHVSAKGLWIADEEIPLREIDRIAVVGGGKAAGAMAAALEGALGPSVVLSKRLAGLVNAPAGAETTTQAVEVRAVRPVGPNEPTPAAAAGVDEMLRLVASLGPRDLCFALLSGGGSALLPAPIDGFELADKLTLTRELSARGATIHELNTMRRELSRFKGGGLARACAAGRLFALILSDVPGDDLATIASGPTVLAQSAPQEAITVLAKFALTNSLAGQHAIAALRHKGQQERDEGAACRVANILIGNNAAAVDAAGIEAERLGYSHAMTSAVEPEGPADEVARHIVGMARSMRDEGGPDCLISGGEPTVRLAPQAMRGLGGRNQQLCLAALAELRDWRGLALVSGGTDGEDGPTDAAGAWVDEEVAATTARLGLNAAAYLTRNDAYHFFERTGGLLKTGPTHTNVCDLRVLTVQR
jgi:glycerate-2-kinase